MRHPRLSAWPVVVLAVLLLAGCTGEARSRSDAASPDPAEGSRSSAGAEQPKPYAGSSAASSRRAGRLPHVFPVRGRAAYSRAHHDYPATDIFARCRTRVVAPVGGVVLEVSRRDRYRAARDNPALRGGRSWSLRGRDGVRYYGSHLRSLAARTRAGARVRAGDLLGTVGQSGNARGTGCHLHFGISPVCAGTGDWWVRRGTVRPFRFLRSWERGGDLSPRRAVRRWRGDHGCPSRPR